MSKVAVIDGANFYVNRLKVIQFGDIHCTGISLDKSTISVDEGETDTLVATPTPANTTDEITWSSSNVRVATVVNGVVTGVHEGTATITVTCGNYSDTCDITVESSIIDASPKAVVLAYKTSTMEFWGYATTAGLASNRGKAVGLNNGYYPILGISLDYEIEGYGSLYPILLPEGAKTIHITCPKFAPIITYYNSKEKAIIGSGQFTRRDACLCVGGEVPSSGTPWSISGWTYNERTITIPDDIVGLDSFSLSFYAANSTDYETWDLSNVEIEYGYE